MSGATGTGSSSNNDTTLAGFLLSAALVTPSATQNTSATVTFLQQIGFCTTEANAIAAALKQLGLAALSTSTGIAPTPVALGAGVTVPTGWLGNIGSSTLLSKLPAVGISAATPVKI
ncbi:MAG TPA: hypothetical protein VK741_11195 [Acetobacteraceae bacterium]|jgi:hypothetical protein|nr:hypothetical protein [Acetobacteraceae bacterium]